MNQSTRSLGLSLLLLLLFLGATVTLQWWLNRETRQLQATAIAEQRAHLLQAIALTGRSPQQWDAAFQQQLGTLLGGTVELVKPAADPSPTPRDFHGLSLIQDLPSAPGWKVQVHFALPAILRMQVLHHRTVAVIVVLSLLVAMVPLLLVLLGARRASLPEGASRVPWAMSRANDLGMEHFARISNERTAALAVEQGARQRAEENLQMNPRCSPNRSMSASASVENCTTTSARHFTRFASPSKVCRKKTRSHRNSANGSTNA